MTNQHVQAIQKRALDVVHGLGLSDSLLRVIDKRQRLDKTIMLGGMVRRRHCLVCTPTHICRGW